MTKTTAANVVSILLVFLAFICWKIVSVRSSVSCSNAIDLERRISLAFDDKGHMTHFGAGLQVVVDNVLSAEECELAVQALGDKFISGAGYGFETNEESFEKPKEFSGLGVHDLASTMTRRQFDMLMSFRRRAQDAAEEAMGVCPGTLKIQFTHFTQKQAGGTHETHADNCFALYSEDRAVPICDETRHHLYPYTSRVVSSVLYLNEDFDGGEFYWADQNTGEPKMVVRPKPGRMMVFSAGAESLHGALPVVDRKEEEPSRRLALAIWFGTDPNMVEAEPSFIEGASQSEL